MFLTGSALRSPNGTPMPQSRKETGGDAASMIAAALKRRFAKANGKADEDDWTEKENRLLARKQEKCHVSTPLFFPVPFEVLTTDSSLRC